MSHHGSFKAYKITNTRDGRAYIGITTQKLRARWNGHVSWAATGRNGVLADAIREHGASAFVIEHLASAKSWDDLLAVEQALVAQERTLVWDGGYNVTEGGEGRHGYIMPEGERQAIRNRFRGVPKSPEHRAKLSAAKTGYKTPPETRAKMSLAHKGKPHSQEWVRRQAAAMTGTKRSAETRAKVSAARRAYEMEKVYTRRQPKEPGIVITLLIWLLVLVLALGVIIWVIQQLPLPAPFGTIAIAIIALIFILILVSMLLGEIPLRPLRLQ